MVTILPHTRVRGRVPPWPWTHGVVAHMFGFPMMARGRDARAILKALDKSQAMIEFRLDGTIVSANAGFLKTMGYTLPEIVGRHHSLFVEVADRTSQTYAQFWESLKRGEHQTAEFKRIGKGGREVWLQASYNPIVGRGGQPYKVVKIATDITAAKLQSADYAGQISAINKSQAVIEFGMDGTITAANDKFLAAMGYRLEENKGSASQYVRRCRLREWS